MTLYDYAARCDVCGAATRDESKVGEAHDSPFCEGDGAGVFEEVPDR